MARVNGTPLEGEQEAKKLTPRSLGCFRKYVDWFKQMNLFGDDQIEKMLEEFRTHYLDGLTSTESLQNPNVKAEITARMEEIRTMAATENGQLSSFVRMAKRRIKL